MAGDPPWKALVRHCQDKRVIAGAQDRDEYLGLRCFSCRGINNIDAFAREVNEQLLAGLMLLSEGDIEALRPLAEDLAKLAVLIPVGMLLLVLKPQQLTGDAFSEQLLVDILHVGQGMGAGHRSRLFGKQPGFQGSVVRLVGKGANECPPAPLCASTRAQCWGQCCRIWRPDAWKASGRSTALRPLSFSHGHPFLSHCSSFGMI